jgi:hypothetical protein
MLSWKKPAKLDSFFHRLKTRLIGRVFQCGLISNFFSSGICRRRIHAIRGRGRWIIIDPGASCPARIESDRENENDQSDQDRHEEEDQQRNYNDNVKQGAIAESGALQNGWK